VVSVAASFPSPKNLHGLPSARICSIGKLQGLAQQKPQIGNVALHLFSDL
jgi:hypothetical protein